MIEKMILEEFGRCLLSIIHTANGTKGKSCFSWYMSLSGLCFLYFFLFSLTSRLCFSTFVVLKWKIMALIDYEQSRLIFLMDSKARERARKLHPARTRDARAEGSDLWYWLSGLVSVLMRNRSTMTTLWSLAHLKTLLTNLAWPFDTVHIKLKYFVHLFQQNNPCTWHSDLWNPRNVSSQVGFFIILSSYKGKKLDNIGRIYLV